MPELGKLVRKSLAESTADSYMNRVREQASDLRERTAEGALDNEGYAVGLELEVYAVDSSADCSLCPLPEEVFDGDAAKELGVHNAELNTDPDQFTDAGLAAQAAEIERRYERARERARAHDADLVCDAMWTIPPSVGAEEYLTATRTEGELTLATNMRQDPRYAAIDQEILAHGGGSIQFSVPGVDRTFPSIVFESLATSIQPHLQVPETAAFPAHYNGAIRTLGPVLALSTNSPFLPPELYDDPASPRELVEQTHHELRIAVFEQSVNTTPTPKVSVPGNIEAVEETIDNVVDDDLVAPFLREWTTDEPRNSFADRHWEFDYKRSTYWRWLRCVIGGDPVEGAGDERSVRIEYRPIPTQPTITDVVGMQFLTVGLIRGLVDANHPLVDLPWDRAKESFYSAATEGLDGTMHWVTADGDHTTDASVIFAELFDLARRGLGGAGVADSTVSTYLDPIERRWEARTTPSTWKKERVREGLAEGRSFEEALWAMQQEYVEQSRETDSFADWL